MPKIQPTEIVAKLRGLYESSDLWTVLDKVTKINTPEKPLLEAAMNLNVGGATDMDGDGFAIFKPRDADIIYHSQETWKALGLSNPGNDRYPSITGGGLYHDLQLWDTAAELHQIPGRLIPEMIKLLWEKTAEEIDLTEYQIEGGHPFARLIALQKVFIEAQNILFVNQDLIKRQLDKACEFMPRNFEETDLQRSRLLNLINAAEQSSGKSKGSEEEETMRTYVRI